MNSRYDALIFDLDGTLWSTPSLCSRAWNAAIREANVSVPEFSPERLGRLMGLSRRELTTAAFPQLADEVRDPLVQACFAKEQQLLTQTPASALLYPGVQAGLARLAEAFPVHVVSNCQLGYMRAFLADPAVGRHITDWECFGRTGRPKAENLASVVARNGHLRPVFVGDTEADEAAALSAGVSFIHAAYGFGTASPECQRARDFPSLVELLLAG